MNNLYKWFICFVCCSVYAFAYAEEKPVVEYNDDNYKIISNLYSESDFEFNILKNMDVRNLKIPKCDDVTLDFQSCKQAICKVTAEFGDVIYKIKGKDEKGDCMFIERTTDLGGMNCALHKDQVSVFSLDLMQRIKQLKGEKVDSTFSVLKAVYKGCTIVEDYKISSEVRINFDYNAELDPEFNLDNFSDVKVVSVLEDLQQKGNGGKSKEAKDKAFEYNSIFF